MRFPIVASAFLFGLYVIYKYVSETLVNGLLTAQFSIATVISTSNLLEISLPFPDQYRKVLKHVKPPKFLKSLLEIDDFDISLASILCTVLVSIPVIFYVVTKYWALNNVFGVLFSIMAIRNIDLANFKVGLLLLWFLFFYDIFWVYGTDVMVTVAKKLDIPIKLLFPYLNNEGVEKFSMLGLGDIVIPGIFVALCLKFDIDRNIKKQVKKAS
jgi:minor histocompatibility antigen H13